MEIAGYIASIFIGIALGLIGGGGSILTVPVLVYLFTVDAVLAYGLLSVYCGCHKCCRFSFLVF